MSKVRRFLRFSHKIADFIVVNLEEPPKSTFSTFLGLFWASFHTKKYSLCSLPDCWCSNTPIRCPEVLRVNPTIDVGV